MLTTLSDLEDIPVVCNYSDKRDCHVTKKV